MSDQQEMFQEESVPEEKELAAFEVEGDENFSQETEDVAEEEVKEEKQPVEEVDDEAKADNVSAEETKDEEVPAEEAASGVAPKQKQSAHVPYTRFQEVNEKYKALQAQQQNSSQQVPQEDVKAPTASPQGVVKYSQLDSEFVETLKTTMPEQYEHIKKQQWIEAAKEELKSDQEKEASVRKEQDLANHYGQFFADRFSKEYPDLQNAESDLHKTYKPRLQQLGQEYPTAVNDPGFAHALTRLVSLEQEVHKLRSTGQEEAKEHVKKTRAAKKEAALTGQAKYSKEVEEDNPWAFAPSWEK